MLLLTFISFGVFLFATSGIYVIPERGMVTYANETYVQNAMLNVRRQKRGGMYVFNFNFTKFHTWNNNVSVDIVFFEYMHNEYRPSFVEMHYKLCDLVNHDYIIGTTLRDSNVVCPHTSTVFSLMNATFVLKAYNYVWPFERCKVEITARLTDHKDILLCRADIFLKIVNAEWHDRMKQ